MKRAVIALMLLGAVVGVPSQGAMGAGARAHETPHLRFVSLPDYAFGFAGDHWGTFARVSITLHANRVVERLTLRTTTRGAFLIGVSSADLCSTTSVGVRQGEQHRVVLNGPQKACLVILESSPRLTILRGKPLPSHQLLRDQHERQSS